MQKFSRWILLAAVAALVAAPVFAQSGSAVEFHGFGGWALGKTDGLNYGMANEDGEYDTAEIAINAAARPVERMSIVAQIRFESSSRENVADLDYAFAEWAFHDAAKLRMGRVKHPFGIYGEIFDVGTLRLFYSLPQSLYGPNGYTARAYNGAGLTGYIPAGSWGFQYDVYGGQIEGDFEAPGLLSTVPEFFDQPNVSIDYRVEDTIGGRLNIYTPVEGLTVGGSAYSGDAETDISVVAKARRDVYAAHLEYVRSGLTLRSEYGHMKNGTDFSTDGSYIEAAYRIGEKWQIGARYDTQEVTIDVNPSRLPPIFSQLLENQEVALGISYWFSPGLVLRASWHQVEGNRFAYPATAEDVLEALQTGELDNRTNMVVVGAQFSF